MIVYKVLMFSVFFIYVIYVLVACILYISYSTSYVAGVTIVCLLRATGLAHQVSCKKIIFRYCTGTGG